MESPRYRIADEKGAYMARDPTPVVLAMGENLQSMQVYNIRATLCELLQFGEEVTFDGVPGPHLEPLNDSAREKMREYWTLFPNSTLDPTRTLGVTGGNSISISETLSRQMNRLLDDAMLTPPPRDDSEVTALRSQVAELSSQVALLLQRSAAPAARRTPA